MREYERTRSKNRFADGTWSANNECAAGTKN